jgi:hypothetical protein
MCRFNFVTLLFFLIKFNILQEQSLTMHHNSLFQWFLNSGMGEPHGGTLKVKLTDFILFGGHAYEKVVKFNVESRIYRKM